MTSRFRNSLHIVETVTIVVTCAVLIWFLITVIPRRGTNSTIALPKEPVSLEDAFTLGDSRASVVLTVYSDFVCPACGRFVRDTMSQLQRTYVENGQLQIAFRNLPLTAIHPMAFKAAIAAQCGGRDGKFWQMHDLFFENQSEVAQGNFSKLAEVAGISAAKCAECAQEPVQTKLRSVVEKDLAQAGSFGISSTPSLLLGRRDSNGRVMLIRAIPNGPFETVAAAIDELKRSSN